jgi:hypothetical protein
MALNRSETIRRGSGLRRNTCSTVVRGCAEHDETVRTFADLLWRSRDQLLPNRSAPGRTLMGRHYAPSDSAWVYAARLISSNRLKLDIKLKSGVRTCGANRAVPHPRMPRGLAY